jgi:hypothetical protein
MESPYQIKNPSPSLLSGFTLMLRLQKEITNLEACQSQKGISMPKIESPFLKEKGGLFPSPSNKSPE